MREGKCGVGYYDYRCWFCVFFVSLKGIKMSVDRAPAGKLASLGMLLRHAFFAGYSCSTAGVDNVKGWVEYDPTGTPAYRTLAEACGLPLPGELWPASEKLHEGSDLAREMAGLRMEIESSFFRPAPAPAQAPAYATGESAWSAGVAAGAEIGEHNLLIALCGAMGVQPGMPKQDLLMLAGLAAREARSRLAGV